MTRGGSGSSFGEGSKTLRVASRYVYGFLRASIGCCTRSLKEATAICRKRFCAHADVSPIHQHQLAVTVPLCLSEVTYSIASLQQLLYIFGAVWTECRTPTASEYEHVATT